MRKLMNKVLGTTLAIAMVVTCMPVANVKNVHAAEKKNTAYKLVWSDEFNGTSLNMNNWNYNIGNSGTDGKNPGWGNNELEYYTDSEKNVSVSDGTLKITAIEEKTVDPKNSKVTYSYTSGRITTAGKQDFQYGRMEARIKLPSLKGVWPAFWMLGVNQKGWPWCGEIDILEAWNTISFAQGAFHWNAGVGDDSPYDNKYVSGQLNASYSRYNWYDKTQWHIYAVEWDNEYIHYFVDDVEFYKVNISTADKKDEGMKSYYFLLNMAVGGNLPGVAPDAGTLPATMEVDYVRAYQRTSDNGTNSAKWTEQNQVPTYQITMKDGKKTVSNVNAYDGETLDLPVLTKKRYTFNGWYTSDGKEITEKYRVRQNTTIVAKWTKVTVKQPKLTKLVNKKKGTIYAKYSIKGKKADSPKGYQIKYGTNKKLKKGKVTSTTSKNITIPFLKSGKTYYVKVRGYKLDSKNKKVFGKWSKIKSITVK